MNILTILGSIGGTMFLFMAIADYVKQFLRWHKKYAEMKKFYEKEHDKKQVTKIPMGFKTDEERKEIESKFKS